MKSKSKTIVFLSFVVILLLLGLYYVIFIYDGNEVYIDTPGSCEIDKPCDAEVSYIREEEKFKTFDDNYLILPFISIDNDNIVNVNKEIEERFNYYKDSFNKDNKKYKTEYHYVVDEDKDVLSLMIIFCGDDLEHNYLCECLTYNIDLTNNEILGNGDLMLKYGVVDNELLDKKLYINEELKVSVLDIAN